MMRRAALAWIASAGLVLGALLLLTRGGVPSAAARLTRPCAAAEVLRAGEAVAPWRLGALDMLTARDGVAVTAARVPCARRVQGGEEIGSVAQAERLAVTHDGGERWTTEGGGLPAGPLPVSQGLAAGQIAAASLRRVWVLNSSQALVTTGDGGRSWRTVAAAPGPVSIGLTRHALWVLSCRLPPPSPTGGALRCAPKLERIDRVSGRLVALTLPPIGRTFEPALSAVDDRSLVVDEAFGDGGGLPLLVSADGGRHWERRALPRWQGHRCPFPANLAVPNRRDWWFICLGGAAAGSSAKALFGTTDGGRSWTLRSEVASLNAPPVPGAISRGEPYGLAAAPPQRLWLALIDGVQVSDTGGRSWSAASGVEQQGNDSIFDVRDARHAWLLSPGRGLWRTTSGVRWTRVGALGPG